MKVIKVSYKTTPILYYHSGQKSKANIPKNELFPKLTEFGKSSGKSVLKAAFSSKSKVAFPKTEVLGKPQISGICVQGYRRNRKNP
ncbi:MAG: hypothetical protein LBG14_06095 [Treponema sp.]|jgi:hypothetical protein|nr:hypothetical protein [Treponema sp.]